MDWDKTKVEIDKAFDVWYATFGRSAIKRQDAKDALDAVCRGYHQDNPKKMIVTQTYVNNKLLARTGG